MTTAHFSDRVSATARAMAQVHQQRSKTGDEVTGRIACTRCGSSLRFTIQANGISRGQCAAAGCLRWCT